MDRLIERYTQTDLAEKNLLTRALEKANEGWDIPEDGIEYDGPDLVVTYLPID